MKRKGLALLLSMIMVCSIVLSACSGKGAENTSAPAAGESPAGSDAAATDVVEPEAPTEITIMLPLNTPETPPDRIKNEVEKLTNTKLTYQFFPADAYEEKLNTAFATGSLPQVTYLKNQASFILFKDAIRDGQFWEIGPYLKEFPNLGKLKEIILNNTKVDGKIYSLYLGRELARQGMIYRKDWADKLGLKAPANVDEYFEMLRAFTEDDPDGNNKDDTVGLTDRNDLIYGAFKTAAAWFGTPNNWGEQEGKLLPEFMFPEYIETMDYFAKIRDAGYMNKDFAATSKTDQVNMFQAGTAGTYIGSMADVNGLFNNLVKNVPTAEVDVQSHINGPKGTFGSWTIPGYNNVVLFPKSAIKDEAELKKILAFFDKMMTPEVANMMYWGIENEHYTIVDGRAKDGDDPDKNIREVKGYKDSVIGEPETNGRYEPYYTLDAANKAVQLSKENEGFMINDPTTTLDSATYTEQGVQLQQIITDASYKYIYRSIDAAGFQAAIKDWRERGGDKIIEEYNAAYKK